MGKKKSLFELPVCAFGTVCVPVCAGTRSFKCVWTVVTHCEGETTDDDTRGDKNKRPAMMGLRGRSLRRSLCRSLRCSLRRSLGSVLSCLIQ